MMTKVKNVGQLCEDCEEVLQACLLRTLASKWATPDRTVREVGEKARAGFEIERPFCGCEGRGPTAEDLANLIRVRAKEIPEIMELELSGVRDGDGFWVGADAAGESLEQLLGLLKEWRRCQEVAEEINRRHDELQEMVEKRS